MYLWSMHSDGTVLLCRHAPAALTNQPIWLAWSLELAQVELEYFFDFFCGTGEPF